MNCQLYNETALVCEQGYNAPMPGKIAALLTAAPLWVAAQAPAGQQPPVFHAATQLVEVDVNVTDSTGAFVPDLGVSDFTVLDQGKERPVEIAYVVRSGKVALATRAAVNGGDRLAEPPSTRRTLVFYFDTTHMTYGQLRRAGAGAEQFLSTELDESDIAGIVIGDHMFNNHLTTNKQELLSGVRAASRAADTISGKAPASVEPGTTGEANPAPSRSAPGDQEVAERLADANKMIVSGRTQSTEYDTLQMLERLVDALARVPGRKNVVYFSAGFSIAGVMPGGKDRDELPILRKITEKAAHSDVHIYSIDVAGLDKGISSSTLFTETQPAFGSLSPSAGYAKGDPRPDDLLTQLALDTGGLLFLNQNYYVDTLQKIDEDTSDYYVLAFRPDSTDKKVRKGAFRSLKVTVRRPDVTLRARKGYVVQ
jgi:VWFA-related protein